MHKINPNVNMPYWEYMNEFAHPENSIIWKLFGHSGKRENNYCVTDGPFAYQQVNYPKPHCLKRQWNENGTIPVWESLELFSSI
jgi:tyrosinase